MSFAEIQIRLFAWQRVEERHWEKVRLLAWYSMTGSHQDPNKFPKSITQFMKLSIDREHTSKISEETRKRFIEATEEYLKKSK